MPGQGNDAERFAAWVERGRPPRSADAELARDLKIAAMLRDAGPSMDPTADEKARARRALMARLAAEHSQSGAPSSMRATLPASDGHYSATPRSRVSTVRDETAAEITSRIAPVEHDGYDTEHDGSYDGYDDAPEVGVASGHVVTGARRSRRDGRHTIPTRPGRLGGSTGPTKRGAARRALLTSSAALLALIALAGGGMFASRNALPGESLYGIKRVAESAGTALTFDDAAKAARNLDLASTRLGEVQQLAAQQGGSSVDPQLVQQAISEFDSSTDAGSSFILTEDEAHDPAKLAQLRAWANDQAKKLTALKAALPAPAQDDVDKSVALLRKLAARAAALQQRDGCDAVTSGRSDGIGPIPAQGECTPSASEDEATSDPSTSANPTSGRGHTSNGTTTDPSRSAPSSTTPNGGLLGGLLGGSPSSTSSPSTEGEPTSESGSSSSATTTTKAPVNIPLPLPVPITIPPLLPGGSGITIG